MVDPQDSINPFPDLATAPPTVAPSLMTGIVQTPTIAMLKVGWRRISSRQWVRNFRDHAVRFYTPPFVRLRICKIMFWSVGYYPEMLRMGVFDKYNQKFPVSYRKDSILTHEHVPGQSDTEMSSIVSTTEMSASSIPAASDANANVVNKSVQIVRNRPSRPPRQSISRRIGDPVKINFGHRPSVIETEKSKKMAALIRKSIGMNPEVKISYPKKDSADKNENEAPTVEPEPTEIPKKGNGKGKKVELSELPPETSPAAPEPAKGKKRKGKKEAAAEPETPTESTADETPAPAKGKKAKGKKEAPPPETPAESTADETTTKAKKGKKGKKSVAPEETTATETETAEAPGAKPAKGKAGKKKK